MKTRLTLALTVCFIFGCHQLEDTAETNPEKESSYHASFVDLTFEGRLEIRNSWNHERTIEQQLLYTIGQLNGERAVGRLDRIELSNVEAVDEGSVKVITYQATLPVAWSKDSGAPDKFDVVLPRDMNSDALKTFAENYGHSCVDYSAHDVTAGSMWYYFRPAQSRCNLKESDVFRTQATVKPSAIETTGKYPEYHKVWQDGRLEVVAIFGRADEERDAASDIGTQNFKSFLGQIRNSLPDIELTQTPETFDGILGVDATEIRLEGKIDDLHSISITALVVDNVRTAGAKFDARYHELTPTADLIIYNGHAGLGENIKALARKGNWKTDQYVMVFMNGCDTYAYVDDALYEAHRNVNPDDTIGTKYVDILTNAMPAYFRSMTGASLAVVRGLLAFEFPMTYEEIFKDIDKSQIVLVTGEDDNEFYPGFGID
jgi:hypothetical protein